MSPLLESWPVAFCLTQLVEVPIYLFAARRLPAWKRWVFAFGASAITHPLLWFLLPWKDGDWQTFFLLGESAVMMIEATWAALFRIANPMTWSVLANGSSILAGFLIGKLVALL